ncbi:hypothetical protein, partial [Streptomyces otsuchiensis]|uniref:hypothetical protein n=1 Tax=Streptomyces otsuchiensis TaxID=2681388 RepID=UPI003F68AC5B
MPAGRSPAAEQRSRPRSPAEDTVGPGTTGAGAAVAQQSLRVAALHQEVMAAHTETHQRFLRLSALAVAALTAAGTTLPAPVRAAPR